MNDPLGEFSEPKKVAVWAEGSHIEPKEFVIPKQNADSSDDIPTIPDIDDFQDILDKEISKPPITNRTDMETASALAEVGGGEGAGTDMVLQVLRAHVPNPVGDAGDNVWTINSLLAQLADEEQDTAT